MTNILPETSTKRETVGDEKQKQIQKQTTIVNTSTYTAEKGNTVTTVTASGADKTPKPDARGMEYFCETKDYNVAEFHEEFKDNLPQLVKVVQGYCGKIADDVFDRDQVIRLQAVSRQKRVISKFKVASHAERLFSIPSTYFEKFCIVKHGKVGKEQFLFEILRGSHLPVTVRLARDRTITVGNTSVSTNNIPNIEMLQTFDEVYLLGNFIYDGEMCTDVVHVPLYLSQLRLSVINGNKGHTVSQWKKFQETLDRTSSGVEYDMEFGNQNIAEYDPKAIHSDATYSYVEPRLYSNIVSIMQRPVGRGVPKVKTNQTTSKSQSTHGGQGNHSAQSVNRAYGDEYEEIENTARPNDAAPNVTHFNKEIESKVKANLHKVIPHKGQTLTEEHITAPPVIPPKPRHTSTSINQNEPPALPQRTSNFHSSKPQASESHNYANNVPRTQISPTVHDKRTITKNPLPTVDTVNQTDSEVVASESVPNVSNKDDVSKLTIDEVAAYLNILGLGQYEDTFKEQMIDGLLLVELDKDILKDDFGMNGIEALKLTQFAKVGHVPV